ncbi:MAG: serine/threonine-protein kinase, partial [Deltaproteobacteria bacterium]
MTAGASEETPRPQIFGGYVLVKALGRGAMGDVHLARPTDTGRGIPSPVVVKRLHGELANRKGFVSRFKHEAAVAVAVDSPHVARVYDVGAVGETLYICMDYVAGWPLSAVLDAILDSGHHASVASVADLIAGGLAGLHALHTAVDPKSKKPLEIVHRDLSPKNLMVGEDGLMRLIDLGLGKSNAQSWRTRTGVVMGSVGYMPPEQARGERVDARADVYAMGVVAFEMLALRNFIKRGPLPAMMKASTAPTFVPPSRYRPDVPPGLDAVIEKALRIDRDERYPTAQAFLEDLRSVVPPSDARGGMRSLLEDLFGSTRQQREEEIRALMMLPVEGESFDVRPTRVFGMRDGILPPELVPTEHRP